MRRTVLWAMLLIAFRVQADEGLYGVWQGIAPASEFDPETTITLSLEESDSFYLLMVAEVSEDEAETFWQDVDVEGPIFQTLTIDINGVFHVRADSLILEIYDFYMHLESEDASYDFFDLLAETMLTAAEEEGEEALDIIEGLIPGLIELMRLGMIEGLNEEFRGTYILDGDTLHLWDDLTLHREGSTPTAVEAIGWGQLKSRF